MFNSSGRGFGAKASSGGGGTTTITVVANYPALPDPTTVPLKFYWCSVSSGVYLTGVYYSNGTSWEYNEADQITVVANYSALPAVATVIGQFFWCSASQGTSWLPGSLGGTYYNAGLYYSNGVTWEYIETPYQATLVEVNTGTNDNKFVTPSTLSNSNWAFTVAKVLATVLSGLSASSGTFTSSSTILEAFGKLKYFLDTTLPTLAPLASPTFTGTVTAPIIDLGNTDTTITRSAAGIMAVEGVVIPSISSTNTITNKRNQPRVLTVTAGATPSTNTDNGDIYSITGLAANITSMTTNLTGTPVTGERVTWEITDNGTARTIAWGASFANSGFLALPTTTAISTKLIVGFEWSGSVWSIIAIA